MKEERYTLFRGFDVQFALSRLHCCEMSLVEMACGCMACGCIVEMALQQYKNRLATHAELSKSVNVRALKFGDFLVFARVLGFVLILRTLHLQFQFFLALQLQTLHTWRLLHMFFSHVTDGLTYQQAVYTSE